ncbi:MAG: TIGR00153 family protein [Waddliaceae bacterium]|nr:TIGR00153 family protein [Waddliaceae bacterium]
MRSILSLFSRSPITPLQAHMEKVAECVKYMKPLFKALEDKDYKLIEEITKTISKLEHEADLLKNDIRYHLPKSVFLPVDRGNLLDILAIQDHIADSAEDAAIVLTLRNLEMLPEFKDDFNEFLDMNLRAFEGAHQVIGEFHELLESSFGGVEAQKVNSLIDEVSHLEHEVDLIQRKLLKKLFSLEDKISYAVFYAWMQIFESIGDLSNASEGLSRRVRTTLELK